MMKLISWNCIMIKLASKKSWGKRKEQVFRKGSWLIHHLQNMSYQKIYAFWYYVISDKVPLSSSQIVDQIEVIQEVVLPGISTLNDEVPDKKKGEKTQFSPKTFLEDEMDLIFPIIFAITPTDGLRNRVIDSSNIREFFSSFSKF